MRPFKEYDKEELEDIVKQSSSMREVSRKLNISNMNAKSTVIRYDIDFSHFKHGKTYEDMIGKKYHMLIVISIDKIKKNDKKRNIRRYANCICDCGNNKTLRADDVKSGRAVSCGCHSKNRWNIVGDKNPAWKGTGKLSATKFSEIKRQARGRKKEFDISIEYLWDLFLEQDRQCALTNLPLDFGRNGHRNETSASLDRIDNDKGYLEGNVRWVLKDINMIRGSYDTDYFIKLCHAVANANLPEG